jgi:hypothetical protein
MSAEAESWLPHGKADSSQRGSAARPSHAGSHPQQGQALYAQEYAGVERVLQTDGNLVDYVTSGHRVLRVR